MVVIELEMTKFKIKYLSEFLKDIFTLCLRLSPFSRSRFFSNKNERVLKKSNNNFNTFSLRLRRSSSYSSCSRFNLSSSSSCLRCCFLRRRRSSSSSANAIASSSTSFVLLLCLDFVRCDSDF
jgi:hypothetical protein